MLSRSLDAGKTWETVEATAFAAAEVQVLDQPMDFANPDFALRSRNGRFWYSEDRGHEWKGPFAFPDFGLENELTSRTDYLIDDEDTLLAFLSVKEPSVQAGLQDRAFSARTNNGGLSWEFQGWMTGYPYGVRSVMPSTVRLRDHELLSVVRRRIDAHDDEDLGRLDVNWVEAEYSNDNGRNWTKQSMVAFTDLSHHNGNPGALARFGDGTLGVAYGFRGSPYGIRAKTSSDDGRTWSHEIILQGRRDRLRPGLPQGGHPPRWPHVRLLLHRHGGEKESAHRLYHLESLTCIGRGTHLRRWFRIGRELHAGVHRKCRTTRLYGVVRHWKEGLSDLLHFNGARTFFAFADFKGDFVAFVQGIALGLGMMNEKVFCLHHPAG